VYLLPRFCSVCIDTVPFPHNVQSVVSSSFWPWVARVTLPIPTAGGNSELDEESSTSGTHTGLLQHTTEGQEKKQARQCLPWYRRGCMARRSVGICFLKWLGVRVDIYV
jgi:hypothetical protein